MSVPQVYLNIPALFSSVQFRKLYYPPRGQFVVRQAEQHQNTNKSNTKQKQNKCISVTNSKTPGTSASGGKGRAGSQWLIYKTNSSRHKSILESIRPQPRYHVPAARRQEPIMGGQRVNRVGQDHLSFPSRPGSVQNRELLQACPCNPATHPHYATEPIFIFSSEGPKPTDKREG